VGQLNTLNNQNDSPDILDVMGLLSKGARDLFLKIKNQMNYRTNVATLRSENLTKGQLNKRSAYYKELITFDLVCRLPATGIIDIDDETQLMYSKHTYIVSPFFILPPHEYVPRIKHIWSQVSDK